MLTQPQTKMKTSSQNNKLCDKMTLSFWQDHKIKWGNMRHHQLQEAYRTHIIITLPEIYAKIISHEEIHF
jgi:hypothetical protein